MRTLVVLNIVYQNSVANYLPITLFDKAKMWFGTMESEMHIFSVIGILISQCHPKANKSGTYSIPLATLNQNE